MPRIELETRIAAPLDACFELSLSVDAHMASMGSHSRERAVAGVTSGGMTLGDTVTWQATHFGLRFRMTSTISAYERPTRFVDEQVRGPFAQWHHEHMFDALGPDETRMTDCIDFRAPGGPIGAAVEQLLLTSYLRRLIERRNAHLKQTLEALPR